MATPLVREWAVELAYKRVGDLLIALRNAGRQGHLLQSLDDVYYRRIGFRDLDGDAYYAIPLVHVIGREVKPLSGSETWDDILESLSISSGRFDMYIRTSTGREALAALLSGRKP